MEQKLLQVQLNPHFIFNSIANLQSSAWLPAIRRNPSATCPFSLGFYGMCWNKAGDFIPLDEEIDSLENYLQLQRMRYAGLSITK